MKNEVNAKELKAALWDTLQKVKKKKLAPIVANAIARQSSEIMRVVKAEIEITRLAGAKPTKALIDSFIDTKKRKDLTNGRS